MTTVLKTLTHFGACLLFFALSSTLQPSKVFGAEGLQRVFEPGMDLGVGLDSLSSQVIPASQCLEAFEFKMLNSADRIYYTYHLAQNKKELAQILSIEASVGGIPIGPISLGIKGALDFNIGHSENSLYLIIQLDVVTG